MSPIENDRDEKTELRIPAGTARKPEKEGLFALTRISPHSHLTPDAS